MSSLRLMQGSSVEQKVDAVVNAANRELHHGGGVCGAVFRKAGYEPLIEACSKIPTPLSDGDAVITPAFGITNAKCIIHAVGPDFGIHPKAFDKLKKAYYNSLFVLKENGYHSISFPLISAGIYAGDLIHPVSESTTQCIRAYKDFIATYPDYELEVLLCVFSPEDMFDARRVFTLE